MALRLRKNIFMPIRTFATAAEGSAEGAHEGGERMWMLMSLFIALPACLVAYINAKKRDEAEHHHPRQEFVAYPHLRMRTKRFPWGDGNHSMFHNPHANALPDGYEE